MNILAMCITWNRPELLGRSIHCFLNQTKAAGARLFVLDDAGQYHSQEHELWSLASTSKRYRSMGTKRNALIDMAVDRYPEVEGFMLWDDDDVYFPHAIECVSNALDEKVWAQPRYALEMNADRRTLRRVETYHRNPGSGDVEGSVCYGGCWAWRLETFRELGRFMDTNDGEDMRLARPCRRQFGDSADSTPGEPWYYYNRENNSIVGEGRGFYEQRGKQRIEFVEKIPIGWNGPDIFSLPIVPGVDVRPW